jgi:hypothetical protein
MTLTAITLQHTRRFGLQGASAMFLKMVLAFVAEVITKRLVGMCGDSQIVDAR